MQINNIKPLSFGGSLQVYDSKSKKFEFIDPREITQIKYDYDSKKTTIQIPDYYANIAAPRGTRYIRNIEVSRNIPVERVLAAYNAAIAAPNNTSIDVI